MPDLFIVRGVYPSEDVMESGYYLGGQHDDDTDDFEFIMDGSPRMEKRNDIIRYTFSGGSVFIQHDNLMETEDEYLGRINKK